MNSGIYQVKNSINGKIYIGSAKDLSIRECQHYNTLRLGKHQNIHLQRSYNKYGNVFEFSVLEYCCELQLLNKEAAWIDDLSPEYNIGSVGGGDNLTNHPDRDDIIKRIKETQAKTIANMSKQERVDLWGRFGEDNPNWKGGVSSNPKYCLDCDSQISNHRTRCQTCKSTGKNNAFYGKSHSEETKLLLSKKFKGREYVGSQEKRLSIDGVEYKSVSFAARELGMKPSTVSWRTRQKDKFPNFKFI